MELLFVLLGMILQAWINNSRAKAYNRNVAMWTIMGILFGILSTIVLLLLGEKTEDEKR